MARTFTGNGHDSLVLKKEGWDKLFGERYGGLIFKRFLFFRITYVDVGFNISTLSNFIYLDLIEGYNLAPPVTRLLDFYLTSYHSYRRDYLRQRGIRNRRGLKYRSCCLLHLLWFRLQLRLRKIDRRESSHGTNTEKLVIKPWVCRPESRTTIKKAEFGALFTKTWIKRIIILYMN